jgi:hypothetical protein
VFVLTVTVTVTQLLMGVRVSLSPAHDCEETMMITVMIMEAGVTVTVMPIARRLEV